MPRQRLLQAKRPGQSPGRIQPRATPWAPVRANERRPVRAQETQASPAAGCVDVSIYDTGVAQTFLSVPSFRTGKNACATQIGVYNEAVSPVDILTTERNAFTDRATSSPPPPLPAPEPKLLPDVMRAPFDCPAGCARRRGARPMTPAPLRRPSRACLQPALR